MTVGVTGGIASGKSTIVERFADLGAATISLDSIARNLMGAGTPLAFEVIRALGSAYAMKADQLSLDRAKLARDVFHDSVFRNQLNAIVHPPIIETMLSSIEQLRSTSLHTVIVVEAPLLFEANMTQYFDKIIVVWCSAKTQRTRLSRRQPELSEIEVEERIMSQMPLDEKCALADIVIDTDRNTADVLNQVSRTYQELNKKS